MSCSRSMTLSSARSAASEVEAGTPATTMESASDPVTIPPSPTWRVKVSSSFCCAASSALPSSRSSAATGSIHSDTAAWPADTLRHVSRAAAPAAAMPLPMGPPYTPNCGVRVNTRAGFYAWILGPWRLCRGLPDHGRALLADHDGGGIGVAGHDGWHDRGVGHPKPVDSVNFELWIDDGVHLAAHTASTHRMEVGDAAGADVGLEVGLLGDVRAGQDLLDHEWLQRRLLGDLAADPHALDQRVVVVGALQEVEANLRRGERIGRLQPHGAAALRCQMDRRETEGGGGLRHHAGAVPLADRPGEHVDLQVRPLEPPVAPHQRADIEAHRGEDRKST